MYNELTSSNTQYLENGEMQSNPPNSLQLRAARAIKQYFEEVQGLSRAHIQVQQEVAQLHEAINGLNNANMVLHQQILELTSKLNDATRTEPGYKADQSLLDGEQQTGDVGN